MLKDGEIKSGHMSAESQYKPLSKDEVRQLALDNMAGQVFGSWQMPEHERHHMRLVFMPIFFSNDFMIKELERDEIIHFYGHMRDALNRAVNGMPIFHSFRTINQADLERVFKMQRLIDALDEPE